MRPGWCGRRSGLGQGCRRDTGDSCSTSGLEVPPGLSNLRVVASGCGHDKLRDETLHSEMPRQFQQASDVVRVRSGDCVANDRGQELFQNLARQAPDYLPDQEGVSMAKADFNQLRQKGFGEPRIEQRQHVQTSSTLRDARHHGPYLLDRIGLVGQADNAWQHGGERTSILCPCVGQHFWRNDDLPASLGQPVAASRVFEPAVSPPTATATPP